MLFQRVIGACIRLGAQWKIIVWVVFFGSLAGFVLGATRGPQSRPAVFWGRERPPLIVGGYYVQRSETDVEAMKSVVKGKDSLGLVIPASFRIDSNGNLYGIHRQGLVEYSRANRIAPLAMVSNTGESGEFSSSLVHNLLNDQEARQRAVSAIYDMVVEYGYSGVNIDFENIPPEDRWIFSLFVGELADQLKRDHLVTTVSVPARTVYDPTNKWHGAYDFDLLGNAADLIFLMAYDEHSRLGDPGPIASIGWVEAAIVHALESIPPQKLVLGIPVYGRDWSRGQETLVVTAGLARAIAETAGVKPVWDRQSKSWSFSYVEQGRSHEVWFEDETSLGYKIDLAAKYGLAGIAIWRLGLEDDPVWDTIEERCSPVKW